MDARLGSGQMCARTSAVLNANSAVIGTGVVSVLHLTFVVICCVLCVLWVWCGVLFLHYFVTGSLNLGVESMWVQRSLFCC